MQTFLAANIGVIQNWVSTGGKLFINCAQNAGISPIPFYFGDVIGPYGLTNTGSISAGQSSHPIFTKSPWCVLLVNLKFQFVLGWPE
jgi:hypothetical protein